MCRKKDGNCSVTIYYTMNNEDFTKTLKDLKQSIVAQAGDSFSNIDLNFDANKAIQDGGNILSSIWQAILDFFKSFGA